MVRPTSPAEKPPCAAFDSHPSDLVLVKSYLRPWVASGLKAGTFIHEADVYAVDPADLTRQYPPAVAQDGERAWYFFTPLRHKSGRGKRKARTVATGDGCWHNEAKSKPVVDGLGGRRQIGHRQSFSFVKKEGGARVRTGWLMMELRLERDHDRGQEAQPEGLVLCKVYRSPRNPEPSDPKPEPAAAPGPSAEADDCEPSAATASEARPKAKADVDESSDTSPAAAASGFKRRRSDGEESSAATVAAPSRHRKTDDEISGAATAAAAPERNEKAEDDEDSAETSAAAPARKRKAADDNESSGAASAAAPAPKRKAGSNTSGAPATVLHCCPQCGFNLDGKSRPETGIAQAAAPQGDETDDSSVKKHPFLEFL